MPSSILNKKSALQIQETILALFIFIIILGICLLAFFRFTNASIENDMLRYETTEYYELLAVIPNFPELKCSTVTSEEECIDSIKALSFPKDKFYSILGFKEISLILPGEKIICNKNNYPNCNYYSLYSNKKKSENLDIISSPISLYFPLNNEYKLANLEIKWYH